MTTTLAATAKDQLITARRVAATATRATRRLRAAEQATEDAQNRAQTELVALQERLAAGETTGDPARDLHILVTGLLAPDNYYVTLASLIDTVQRHPDQLMVTEATRGGSFELAILPAKPRVEYAPPRGNSRAHLHIPTALHTMSSDRAAMPVSRYLEIGLPHQFARPLTCIIGNDSVAEWFAGLKLDHQYDLWVMSRQLGRPLRPDDALRRLITTKREKVLWNMSEAERLWHEAQATLQYALTNPEVVAKDPFKYPAIREIRGASITLRFERLERAVTTTVEKLLVLLRRAVFELDMGGNEEVLRLAEHFGLSESA